MSDIRAFGMALVLRAIREALSAHVRPDTREQIIATALERFELELSPAGEALRLFLVGPLWDSTAAVIGSEGAGAMVEELCEVLKDRFAGEGPLSRPTPSRINLDRNSAGPLFGDDLVVLLASPRLEAKGELKTQLTGHAVLIDVLDAHEAVAWATRYELNAPVVVIDCRRRVREVEPLRRDLPDGSVVILWGDQAPTPPPTPGVRWVTCGDQATAAEIGTLIQQLRRAA